MRPEVWRIHAPSLPAPLRRQNPLNAGTVEAVGLFLTTAL